MNLLMWSDLQFSVGMVLYYFNIKESQTGQQAFHSFALGLLMALNTVQRIQGLLLSKKTS